MSLVSVLMPGLRALRVPVAVGLVWMGALALAWHPYWADLAENPAFHSLAVMQQYVPVALQLGLALFAAYTLGIFATGVSRDLSRGLGRWWRRTLFEKSELELRRWLMLWQFWEWLYPSLAVSEVITRKILSATLGRHDNGLLRSLVPSSLLDAELDLAVLRLSKDSPDQFQQYDRLVAEADLRRGLAVPMCILFVALGTMAQSGTLTPALVALGMVLSLYLSGQAHRKQNAAVRHMLTAIGLSWTSTPALTGIRMQLDDIDARPSSESRKASAKVTAVVSVVIDTLQGSSLTKYLTGLRHPSRAQVLQDYLRKDTLTKIYGKSFVDAQVGQRANFEGRHRAN